MKKRLLAVCLLAAMMLSTACSNVPAEGTTEQTSGETTAETTAAETEPVVADDLGEYDFKGGTFHIMTRFTPLFYPYHNVDETTGDSMNDAVYERNRALEARFKFTLKESYYDYTKEGNDFPRTLMMAGDKTYDMFVGRCVHMFNYAVENMIHPAQDIPVISMEKPYWSEKLNADLTVGGTQYFAIGDFNVSAMDFTHVLLFNKEMMEANGLGDPYQTVKDGKWTYDAFEEMCKKVKSDLNGDGVMDDKDRYGYTSLVKQVMPGFWIGADVVTIGRDAAGALTYSAPQDEKLVSVFQRIYEMIWNDNLWHRNVENWAPATNDAELNLFKNGQALFTNASCFQVTTMMRDSEADFGILPYPKLDEAQKEYAARIEGCELFGIPVYEDNMEMAGVILEALACASYHEVVPTYYDVVLKVKAVRDNASADMLEIIFANRVFDYGDTILATELRDGIIRQKFEKDDRNIVSNLTGVEGKVLKKLDTLNGKKAG